MPPGLANPPSSRLRSILSWLRFRIPEGRPLSDAVWRRRHRGILVLLWAHVAGLFVFAVVTGSEPLHAFEEAGVIAVMALLAGFVRWGRKFTETLACLGLLTSSALLVHFSGGYIEMHFHFFVMVGLMALYQDWLPFLLAIGYVVVHHGLVGVLEPRSVFNHAAAWNNPWEWAAIHGVFILGMSVVSLIAWRLNEVANQRGELILNSAGEGIVGVDLEGRMTFANRAAATMVGATVDDLVGRPFQELLASPGDVPSWNPSTLSAGTGAVVETMFRGEGRPPFPVAYVTSPIEQLGAVGGAVVVFTDITEGRRATEALRESERRFRSVTESAVDAIIAADIKGNVVSWNSGARAMFGYTDAEILGRPLTMLMPERYHSAHHQGLARASERGRPVIGRSLEFHGLRKDGTEFPIEVSLGSWETEQGRFYAGVIRDITERKLAEETLRQTEQQLRQSQKMEAVGQLAGGIAHDFNNLLTVVLGRADLLLEREPPGGELRRDIELIATTAGRAAVLVRQLLAFSRNQVLQPKVCDLNVIVRSLVSMLHRIIGEHIELVTTLQRNLGPVRVDLAQIEQVIVNLVVNARDAMPDGGTLTIETMELAEAEVAAGHPDLSPGPYVVLTVRDTGTGMDAEVQAHLFEPFFTTKPQGKGTGLGLATVYGIVKQHDGAIHAESAVGQGAVFRVYLPRVDEAVAAAEEAAAAPRRGSETVLLVEDEVEVRELIGEILRANGYTVFAKGPEDALLVAEQHPDNIHLLLTDVVMPRVSGRELAAQIVRMRPRTRVLYMSGYTDEAIVHHGVIDHSRLLAKPFRTIDLLRKVREILDR